MSPARQRDDLVESLTFSRGICGDALGLGVGLLVDVHQARGIDGGVGLGR